MASISFLNQKNRLKAAFLATIFLVSTLSAIFSQAIPASASSPLIYTTHSAESELVDELTKYQTVGGPHAMYE